MDLLLYISDTTDFVQNVCRPYIYFFFSTIHDFLIDVISFSCLYSIVCPEKNPVFLCYLTISQFILFRQFFTDVTPTYMISKIFPCQTFEPSMHCTKPRNIFQTYNRHNAIKHYKCRSAFNIFTEDAFNPNKSVAAPKQHTNIQTSITFALLTGITLPLYSTLLQIDDVLS